MAAPGSIRVQDVGNGTDWSVGTSGNISWAQGSFPSVSGVTSEFDGASNLYWLELNSNFFGGAPPCTGAANPSSCLGWQQFAYANPGNIFMQYWLLNFGNTCPSGWNTSGSDCWVGSKGLTIPAQPISNLANLVLWGIADGTDTVEMSTGDGNIYAIGQPSVLNLVQHWDVAEFNVFGWGPGSQAVFNAGSSIVVQTLTGSATPTTPPPSCLLEGFTGETNNLNLVSNSCCSFGGASTGIQFTESNASSATAFPGGYFFNNGTGYWANNAGQYCKLASGGAPSGSPTFACIPSSMTFDGNCSPCPSGQTLCQGQCVDESTDSKNCGACGNACSTQDCCSKGSCVAETVCGCGISPRPCKCGPGMTGFLCPGDVCSCY
jgi:hypothetical protein